MRIFKPKFCEECPFFREEETRCHTYYHCGLFPEFDPGKDFSPWEQKMDGCTVERIMISKIKPCGEIKP